MSQEILQLAYPDKATPIVSSGLPFTEACSKHVKETFRATRVYLIASGSITKNTSFTSDLQSALGHILAKTRVGMTPHTLMSEVLEIVEDCRTVDADCIITLGGGSLSDAAKIIAFALANNVKTQDQLVKLPHMGPTTENLPANPSTIPIICIPTSLSGGEYTTYAGVTYPQTGEKIQFSPPITSPSLIILSGVLAASTPLSIWLQSGFRAVDHCVEILAGLRSTDEVDKSATQGLQRLIPGLLKTKKLFDRGESGGEEDINAREECQKGVIQSILCGHRHILPGASHGIGHMLGPMYNVGHGQTSCILLPAVCKYNALHGPPQIRSRQQDIKNTLWGLPEAKDLFERKGLGEGNDLGDLLDAIVRELGLKRSLSEVGVGREKFDKLAEISLRDPCLVNNPVPIVRKEQVMEILELCA